MKKTLAALLTAMLAAVPGAFAQDLQTASPAPASPAAEFLSVTDPLPPLAAATAPQEPVPLPPAMAVATAPSTSTAIRPLPAAVPPAAVPAAAAPAPAAVPAATVSLPAVESSLYVATNKFTLEQTFADATLDKLKRSGGSRTFAIVATERESVKLTAKGAKQNIKDAVRELQRAGGTLYLCDRDAKQAGVETKDLLPGVKIERALSKQELQPDAAVTSDLRRVRRACSASA